MCNIVLKIRTLATLILQVPGSGVPRDLQDYQDRVEHPAGHRPQLGDQLSLQLTCSVAPWTQAVKYWGGQGKSRPRTNEPH